MDIVNAGNHIRHHRKKAGLSQQELARILGYTNEGAISRHEQSVTIPPLLTAIGYEVVFCIPVSKIFPELRVAVKHAITPRLSELEGNLQERVGKAVRASIIAQKLAWFDERRALPDE